MALPRRNFHASSSERPACTMMSVATFFECGKVESACG